MKIVYIKRTIFTGIAVWLGVRGLQQLKKREGHFFYDWIRDFKLRKGVNK